MGTDAVGIPFIIECVDGIPLSFVSSLGAIGSFDERFSFGFPFVKSVLIWPGDERGVCLWLEFVNTLSPAVSSDLPSSTW